MMPIPNSNVPFGQATEMSKNDIDRLNKLYKCCKYNVESVMSDTKLNFKQSLQYMPGTCQVGQSLFKICILFNFKDPSLLLTKTKSEVIILIKTLKWSTNDTRNMSAASLLFFL